MRKNSTVHDVIVCLLALALSIAHFNCAGRGLLTDTYPPDYYQVPRLLPDEPVKPNSTFIVYSDTQTSWRLKERFLKKSNWTSWKMLIFPFYELYLLGNGIVGGINWLRRVPDYGGKERRFIRDAVYAEAMRSSAAFIINVGDIVAYDGRRPAHWALFLDENKVEHPLLRQIPYLPVIGNHEHANDSVYGFANYQAVFDYPRFYVVELADVDLLIVDSNLIIDQEQYIDDGLQDEMFAKWFVSEGGAQEPAWLERQLAACDKSFKIVVMHHPPISYAKHHGDWLNSANGRDLKAKRQKLLDLFEKHGVQMVFSGHDHIYQHNVLRYAGDKQLHFLVGGGGGASLRELFDAKGQMQIQQHFEDDGLEVFLAKQEKVYHYFVVKVDPREILVTVLEVTGEREYPTRLVEEIRLVKTGRG